MAGDDAAYAGQAEPAALELGSYVEALEHPEERSGLGRAEPDTVVAYEEDLFAAGGIAGQQAQLDEGGAAAAGEFESVAQQVGEHLAQKGRIGPDLGQCCEPDFHTAPGELAGEFAAHLSKEGGHAYRAAPQLGAGEAGVGQQAVEALAQPGGFGSDFSQGVGTLGVELYGEALVQELGGVADLMQWGAQFLGEGG